MQRKLRHDPWFGETTCFACHWIIRGEVPFSLSASAPMVSRPDVDPEERTSPEEPRSPFRRRRDVTCTHDADPAKLEACDTVELAWPPMDASSPFTQRDSLNLSFGSPVSPDDGLRPQRGLP